VIGFTFCFGTGNAVDEKLHASLSEEFEWGSPSACARVRWSNLRYSERSELRGSSEGNRQFCGLE
jgi:hypothetical protein